MPAPVITTQPADLTVNVGERASFNLSAAGGAITYCWYKLDPGGTTATAVNSGGTLDGNITGARTAAISFYPARAEHAGSYFCTATNGTGPTTSFTVVLTVNGPPTPGDGGIPEASAGGLSAPRYASAATVFAQFFAESFGTAGVYYDGDWTTAQPDGMGWPEFPFAQDGDRATVIVKRRYMQRAQFFQPTALGTPCSYNPALLLLDESDFKLEIGGVVSWIRTYATLPAARDVLESFSYGFQYVVGGESLRLAETAFEVSSRVRCEYYHVKDRAQWPTLFAPRFLQLADNSFFKRGQGTLTQSGSFFISPDAEILAEDSKEKVWKYPFMERRSRYIAGPTRAFWGSSLNVTFPTTP